MPALHRLLLSAFAILFVVFPACTSRVDETDLNKVVDLFYHPGKQNIDPSRTYPFLSTRTREQVSLDAWKSIMASQEYVLESVRVLKKETVNNKTYGIVALNSSNGGKRSMGTATWVLEQNAWRRLRLPKAVDDLSNAFNKGDLAGVEARAEELLMSDPFSLEAYEALLLALDAGNSDRTKSRARDKAGIVQAMLAINPDDTNSLVLAATHAQDMKSARQYLKKLEGTVAYHTAADKIAAQHPGIEDKSTFSGKQAESEAALIQKLIGLADLKRFAEFKKLDAGDKTYESLSKYLDAHNPEDAAVYAGKLAMAYHKAGYKKRAAQWLDFGHEHDPLNTPLYEMDDLIAPEKQ